MDSKLCSICDTCLRKEKLDCPKEYMRFGIEEAIVYRCGAYLLKELPDGR